MHQRRPLPGRKLSRRVWLPPSRPELAVSHRGNCSGDVRGAHAAGGVATGAEAQKPGAQSLEASVTDRTREGRMERGTRTHTHTRPLPIHVDSAHSGRRKGALQHCIRLSGQHQDFPGSPQGLAPHRPSHSSMGWSPGLRRPGHRGGTQLSPGNRGHS